MSALIPISQHQIASETIQTVNARELHAFLGVKDKFTMWIQRRIETFGFVQDIDYVVSRFGERTNDTKSYFVTIDMAKELSMVERTPKGKEARRYFIACEKELTRRTSTPTPVSAPTADLAMYLDAGRLLGTPLHIVQQEAVKQVEAQHHVNFRPYLLAAPAQHNILPEVEMLEPTELAPHIGEKSGIGANLKLAALGLQERDAGRSWTPTVQGLPWCTRHAWTKGTKSGYNYKWNVEAIRHLI